MIFSIMTMVLTRTRYCSTHSTVRLVFHRQSVNSSSGRLGASATAGGLYILNKCGAIQPVYECHCNVRKQRERKINMDKQGALVRHDM